MTQNNKVTDLINSFNTQRKSLIEVLKTEFKNIFTEVFEKTDVGCFYWTQYTPYFNDGDECVFSVGDIAVLKNSTPEEKYWEDCKQYPDTRKILWWKSYLETDKVPTDFMSSYDTDEKMLASYFKCTRVEKFEKTVGTLFKDVSYKDLTELANEAVIIENTLDALVSIPDDIYKELFGDHVSVTVNADGVHIEDYDHD